MRRHSPVGWATRNNPRGQQATVPRLREPHAPPLLSRVMVIVVPGIRVGNAEVTVAHLRPQPKDYTMSENIEDPRHALPKLKPRGGLRPRQPARKRRCAPARSSGAAAEAPTTAAVLKQLRPPVATMRRRRRRSQVEAAETTPKSVPE